MPHDEFVTECVRQFNAGTECMPPAAAIGHKLTILFVEIIECRRDLARLHDRILKLPKEIVMDITQSPQYQDLVTRVTAVQDTEAAAVTALNGLGAQIQQLVADQNLDALNALGAELTAANTPLAAAIIANTTPPGGTGGAGQGNGTQTASAKRA